MGMLKAFFAPDGEKQDVYFLEVVAAVSEFIGKWIAVI